MKSEIERLEKIDKFSTDLFEKISRITLEETQRDDVDESIVITCILSVCLRYVTSCICSIQYKPDDPSIAKKRIELAELFCENLQNNLKMINKEEHLS